MIGVAIGVLVGLLALSLPVAAALMGLGLTLDIFYSFLPLRRVLGDTAWGVATDVVLFSIPLFVMLGEIMLRSGIAERMYDAMARWLGWLPGGLMHANVGTCTMFAAISGSSVATAATVGTVAVGQIKAQGYNERLFLGTIAAGGTLGILIPPSIPLIIYAALTDTSIPQLYLAGILPGLILALLFMLTVILACVLRPSWGGQRPRVTWAERRACLPDLLPPFLIFVAVIGSIYAGLATPTESAALGVLAALVLAWRLKALSLAMLRAVFEGTMRTTAMIMLILTAAYFLNFIIGSIGLGRMVTEAIGALGLTPTETIIAIVVFYFVLGMFMETLSMMVATVPLVMPVVVSLGLDPVWFGVLMMLLLETALITPPVGFNLFVVQGVRERGPVKDVVIGAVPFVMTLLVMIALLIAFPQIALWLPQALR
ncbi:TRAP transporter large permease [Roseomonas sp. HF4]|uniref:TRAP transporter large permease n=1 Tax=Roseomonas sp. HF4 TaxID=2562313 RepID=UPI0010C01A78|nr:TRAP transporter large permease [Roseomonas sp. HF4]